MKPHKPVFSVREVKINFYKIDNRSNINLLVSSVISLTFNAENHNKFGIGYSPSRFLVYHEGLPIGTIRIPRFFQPPHSDDVRVPSRVLLQCVNLSEIVDKASLRENSKQNTAQMKIIGDARAHVWILHIKLLEIKVSGAYPFFKIIIMIIIITIKPFLPFFRFNYILGYNSTKKFYRVRFYQI